MKPNLPLILSAAALAAVSPAMADQTRTSAEKDNITVVLEMFDAGWGANEGWQEVWGEHVAADVITYFHSHPPMKGRDAAIAFNAELFAGFPTLAMEVVSVVAEGDTVIVRGQLNGTQDGPFLGVPASGAAVDVPDVTMFRLNDGKIVENRYFTDLLAVMTAIGAVPAME